MLRNIRRCQRRPGRECERPADGDHALGLGPRLVLGGEANEATDRLLQALRIGRLLFAKHRIDAPLDAVHFLHRPLLLRLNLGQFRQGTLGLIVDTRDELVYVVPVDGHLRNSTGWQRAHL